MDSLAAKKGHLRDSMVAILVCAASSLCVATFAQEVRSPLVPAPPPMKFVSRNDRAEISSAKDAKARIRVSMGLAETRLHNAEQMTIGKQYDEAAGELGSYEALIEDALRYLTEGQKSSGKVRDLYRRVELTLRAQAPRLELIRRSTPLEYALHVKAVAEYTRTARSEALNSFYGDTVFKGEAFREEPKSTGDEHAGDVLPARQGKQP